MTLRENASKVENTSTLCFNIVAASFQFHGSEMENQKAFECDFKPTSTLSKEREPFMQVRFISGSIAHLNWLSNGFDYGIIGVTSAPMALQPATQLYRPFSHNAPPVQGR